MPDIALTELLIVFTDFTGYNTEVNRLADLDVAAVMEDWYALAGTAMHACGGRVVKFIGDATLAVFPPERIDQAIRGLVQLRQDSDRFMTSRGWGCRLRVRAHLGHVAAGHFGQGTERRYDVLGRAVNTTAKLFMEKGPLVVSPEASARLSPETRQLVTAQHA